MASRAFPHWGKAALLLAACALSACHVLDTENEAGRSKDAEGFPKADRPISPIMSTRWSDEMSRDKVNEAQQIMDIAGVMPGMTVADIGAGEGYYTVRLAVRVGAEGRVLAEDIVPEVIDALGQRINRENLQNISVKLGRPDNPNLPANSFDRIFMVHMYHEIREPYAFLWHMHPALKLGGEIVVVDADRPTSLHGTPPRLLTCEFAAVGYRLVQMQPKPEAGGYVARFRKVLQRPDMTEITPCAIINEGVKAE